MKQKQRSIVFLLLTINAIAILTVGGSVKEDISVSQITTNGPQVLINLDYDLESPPERDETESLVILVLFTLPVEKDMMGIAGSMMFFRTNLGDNLLFWTEGDPFIFNTPWYSGDEYSHYQTSYHDLMLTFIEFPEINTPELKIHVLAKKFQTGEVNQFTTDFREVLEVFLPDLPSFYKKPVTVETTTTTTPDTTTTSQDETSTDTTGEITSGFLLLTSVGLVLISIRSKKQRKT
jgi:hypothetical protein